MPRRNILAETVNLARMMKTDGISTIQVTQAVVSRLEGQYRFERQPDLNRRKGVPIQVYRLLPGAAAAGGRQGELDSGSLLGVGRHRDGAVSPLPAACQRTAASRIIVPNSALYKPSFANLSRPTLVRTTILEVSFSYSDPPSRVKQVLTNLARETPRVLPTPAPVVRIVKYGDFAICYEIYLSVSQQAETAVVRDGFMTRVWYAVQRHGLTIPYPIATEIAAQAKDFQFDPLHEARTVLQSHARFAESVDTRTD